MGEQRVHFRIDLQTEAWVADALCETWTAISLLNISGGGLAFASGREFAADTLRRFRFYLPGCPEKISVSAKIGYSRKHAFMPGFRVGAIFVHVGDEEAALIRQFIEAQAAPRGRMPVDAGRNGAGSERLPQLATPDAPF